MNSVKVFFVVLVMLLLTSVNNAHASFFAVDSTTDAVDANPGNGVCATSGGICTLRAAVMEANALAGTDTITIPSGTFTLSISGTNEDASATGDIDITENLVINGDGQSSTIIDGSGIDRVFHVTGAYTVSISGMTITGGSSAGGNGGGILSSGTLTVTNSTISSNAATWYGGGISSASTLAVITSTISSNSAHGGGGISSAGTLTVTNSIISSNSSIDDGGGIYNWSLATITDSTINGNAAKHYGAGIYNQSGSTLTITDSTISSNTATGGDYNYGAGIANWGTVTVTNSTISGNTASNNSATGKGGGILSTGTFTVTNSTINGNSADNGGGICNYGILTLAGSTLSGNLATQGSGSGGGLFNNGSASLTNVTISGNQAAIYGGGIFTNEGTTNSIENCTIADNQNLSTSAGAGIFGNGYSAHNIRNTILSNNQNSNGIYNCYQVFVSLGYNLSSDNSCNNFTQTGDIQNTNPLLGSLQDNGGLTFTHALLPESPALDAGDPVNYPETDQRGTSRPQGSGSDIGAYEWIDQSGPLPDLTGNWYEPITEQCKVKVEGLVCKIKGKLLFGNAGEADALNVKVRFYLSDDDSYDEDDVLLKEEIKKNIEAGKVYKKSFKAVLPVGISLEGRYIIVYIDADNTTEESNERNNFVVYGEEDN